MCFSDIFVVYGDEAVEFIKLYDNVATEALIKYGDEALEVLTDYGDEAAEGFKNGKTPDEIRADIESGSNYGYPDGVGTLLDGKPELSGSTRDKLLSIVQDEELYKIVDQLYRPGATVGDGGTAAILVDEFNNGTSKHLQKATERLKQLQELQKSGELNLSDLDIIEALIEDLEYAISLFD